MIKRLLFVVALTMASLTVGSTVQAATPSLAARTAEDQAAAVAKINFDERRPALAPAVQAEVNEVNRLLPYVTVTPGNVRVDRAKALAAGVDPEVVTDFQQGLTAGNAAFAACVGRTAYYKRMGGLVHEVWMNSCDTRAVSSAMKGGAGVATIAATILAATGLGIPAGVIVGIAGGLYTIGAAALDYCNRYGRGSIVKNVGTPCQNQPA